MPNSSYRMCGLFSQVRAWPRRIAVLAGLGLTAACPAPEPTPETIDLVDSLPTSGVVVLRTPGGFGLLDPRTGTPSALQYPLLAVGDSVLDVSPDGSMLAHITPGRAVVVSRVVHDGGAPSLVQVRAWEDLRGPSAVHFNAYGDRVYTDNDWLNLQTGERTFCAETIAHGDVLVQRLHALPSGYDYMCDEARHRDGVELTPSYDPFDLGYRDLADGAIQPTLDGAFDSPQWRTAPLALRGTDVRPGVPLTRAHLDGSHWYGEAAIHGDYVVVEQGNNGGPTPVDVCVEYNSDNKAEDSHRTRFHDNMNAGEATVTRDLWALDAALAPYYGQRDSQALGPVAVHPETGEVLYGVSLRDIARESCSNPVRGFVLQGANAGGPTTRIDFYADLPDMRAGGLRTADAPNLSAVRRGYGLVPYADGGFLLPFSGLAASNNATIHGFVGRMGDRDRAFVRGDILTTTGRHALGTRRLDDGRTALCMAAVAGPGATSCVLQPVAGTPVALAGHGVMPGDTAHGPVIHGLSHVAREPGQVLTIFGRGFGGAGRVTIGTHEIASQDALFWADGRIDVVATAEWPEKGVLHVHSGAKHTAADGIARWVGRTPAVNVPVAAFPDTLTLRQGLNRFAFDMLPMETRIDGVPRDADGRFSMLSEGAETEATAVYRGLRIDDWMRFIRVTTEPGQVADGAWQPARVAPPLPPAAARQGYAHIAGSMLDVDHAVRVRESGAFLALDTVERTALNVPNPLGVPTMFRHLPGGAFSFDRVFESRATWLSGWTDVGGKLRADEAAAACDPGMQDMAIVGNLAVATGRDLRFGSVPAAFQVSTTASASGPGTFGPLVTDGPALFAPAGLVGPSGPAVIAWHARADGGFDAYQWSTDGTGPTPVDIAVDGPALLNTLGGTWRTYAAGSAVVYHRPGAESAALLDLAEQPMLRALDMPGALSTLTFDPSGARLIAVLQDGTVHSAPLGRGPFGWTALDLSPVLGDGTAVKPVAATPLPSGRWLIRGTTEVQPAWASGRTFDVHSPAIP